MKNVNTYIANGKNVNVENVSPNGKKLTCGDGMMILRKTNAGWKCGASKGNCREQAAMEQVFYKHIIG